MTILMHSIYFFLGGGAGEVNKVNYERCANGE